jgi:hypothetical protein
VWQCPAKDLWGVYLQPRVEVKRWFGVEVPGFTTGVEVVVTVAAKILEPGLAAYACKKGSYVLLCLGKSWPPTVTVADMCGIKSVAGCSMSLHVLVRGGAPSEVNGGAPSEEEKRKLVKTLQAVKNWQDLVKGYYQYELQAMCKDLGVGGYSKDTSADALAQLLFKSYRPVREISSYWSVKTKPEPPRVSAAAEREGRPTAKRQPSDTTDTAVNGEAGGPYAVTDVKRRCLAARTGSTSALPHVSSHARTHTCAPTRTHGRARDTRQTRTCHTHVTHTHARARTRAHAHTQLTH